MDQLPQIDTPIQKILAEIQEIEGALNLIIDRVQALVPMDNWDEMTFVKLMQLLESRRHRIMEQLKITFKPNKELKCEPGIENRQAPGK